MSEKDYYTILQLNPSAEAELVEAAYRCLARKYHPDRNADPQAGQRMRELNRAYAVLSDPAKRAAYDLRRLGASAGAGGATVTRARGHRPSTGQRYAAGSSSGRYSWLVLFAAVLVLGYVVATWDDDFDPSTPPSVIRPIVDASTRADRFIDRRLRSIGLAPERRVAPRATLPTLGQRDGPDCGSSGTRLDPPPFTSCP